MMPRHEADAGVSLDVFWQAGQDRSDLDVGLQNPIPALDVGQ